MSYHSSFPLICLLINLVWFESYVHNVDDKKEISLCDERYNCEVTYIKIEEQVEYLNNMNTKASDFRTEFS